MKNQNFAPWKYFSSRRNVTLAQFIETRGVQTYKDLELAMLRMQIHCPSEEEYVEAVKALEPKKRASSVKKPAATKKPVETKPPRKKPSAPRTRKKSTPKSTASKPAE